MNKTYYMYLLNFIFNGFEMELFSPYDIMLIFKRLYNSKNDLGTYQCCGLFFKKVYLRLNENAHEMFSKIVHWKIACITRDTRCKYLNIKYPRK